MRNRAKNVCSTFAENNFFEIHTDPAADKNPMQM